MSVRCKSNHVKTITSTIGTTNQVRRAVPPGRWSVTIGSVPNRTIALGMAPTGTNRVPKINVMSPTKIDCVPSVTISVWRRKRWMKKALIAPSVMPNRPERAKANSMLSIPVAIMIRTVAYPPKIATAVKETSIPPEASTTSAPIASIIVPALERTI